MPRHGPPQSKLDDTAFPIRVKLRAPSAGVGNLLTDMLLWLSDEVGPGDYAFRPGISRAMQ